MKKILFPLFALTLIFASCGPDADLVASGKSHSCKLKELSEQLAEDPGNQEIMEEIKTYSSYLETVIESAGEGKMAEMEEAIKEASKSCD